jgi:D-glycero-D-manno-heptose 1,7-bisphosphate phosphatase
MKKAVFLDKDGTLIRDIPYNVDVSLITLTPNAVEGLKMLQDNGYLLIVVSNQSGLALGYFSEKELAAASTHICSVLQEYGIELHAFYYCPHAGEDCSCRKPLPGLLLQAARDYDIDLSCSWMVGDILNDVEAGRRAGCRTILVDNGNETEWHIDAFRVPHHSVKDLRAAADVILSQNEVYAAITRSV